LDCAILDDARAGEEEGARPRAPNERASMVVAGEGVLREEDPK